MAAWRRQGRRWPGAILMLALVALLAGCALPPLPWQQAQRGPAPLPAAQQIAHVAMATNEDISETLDPAAADSFPSGEAQLLSLLYSGLFTLDASHHPIPALATSYSVSADGLRYTFHLRPGAHFAEGTPLTSADVAFSLNRAMSGCLPSTPTFSYRAVASPFFANVKDEPDFAAMCHGGPLPGQRAITTLIGDALLTPDPSALALILARPDDALLDKLAEPYSLVVEQSIVTRFGPHWTSHLADGGGQGTSGMYAVAAWQSWGPNVYGSYTDASITLRAASAYWGQQPLLRQVVIALRIFFALEPSDDIALGASPPEQFKLQVGSAGLIFHTAPVRAMEYLTLNPQVAPLGDAQLRQALALALDKTALAKSDGGVATNHVLPPGTGSYPSALSGQIATAPLTGDLKQAQALWQSYVQNQCGGNASRCAPITITFTGRNVTPQFEAAILARWRTALPGIQLMPLETAGLLTDLNAPAPAVVDAPWVENYPDPQDWLSSFAVAPGEAQSPESAPPLVDEPQADALVAQAEATRDPTARLALYQQAENTLLNDGVVVPIMQEQDSWAIKPTVVNFPANPAPWIAPDAWARIYLTAPAAK